MVVLSGHPGGASGNWACPAEKRGRTERRSEGRRVLGEPSPRAPLHRPHGQDQSVRSCWACSQPSVTPAQTAPSVRTRGCGAAAAEASVQSQLPLWGGRGPPISIRSPGPGAGSTVRNGAATPMPRWATTPRPRSRGSRAPGAQGHERLRASRPWSEREALAADLSRGPGSPALAPTIAHGTGPERLGEHEGPTRKAPQNVGPSPAPELLGTLPCDTVLGSLT